MVDAEYVVIAYPIGVAERLSALTPAEREVVLGAVDGRTSNDIAARRGTSRRTVENLLSRAFKKLAVSSRSELTALLMLTGR